MKHTRNIVLILSVLVILYFIHDPVSLQYYFRNTLGRAMLLLFIVTITTIHPPIGILVSLCILGLYNSKVLEGLENMDTEKKVISPVSSPSPSSPTSSTLSSTPSTTSIPKKEVITTTPDAVFNKTKEGFVSNNSHPLSPAPYGMERNRIISAEHNIRPKASNTLLISKHKDSSDGEPVSNYSGKEGFSSLNAKY